MRILATKSFAHKAVRSLCAVSYCTLLAVAIAGCGGGGGSSSSTPSPSPSPGVSPSPSPSAPVKAQVTINWSQRSRVVGLSSALSAKIVLSGEESDNGADIVILADRPAGAGAPVQVYTSAVTATVGKSFLLTVTFYSNTGETGSIVGTAQASAILLPSGSIDTTISTVGLINAISVLPNQTVAQGQSTTIEYSATDAAGNVLMIQPGGESLTVTSGASHVQQSAGTLVGVSPGTASVVVTLDQVSSPAASFVVTSNTAIASPISSLTISWNKTYQFSASVTGSDVQDPSVSYSLVNSPADVTISPTGLLTTGKTEGTFQVVITSNYDPTKTVTVSVTVKSKVAVAITTKPVNIGTGATFQLGVAVTDPDGPVPDTGVTWSIVDPVSGAAITNGGSVDANGVYTAPSTAGTYRVIATSVYDPRKSDFVDITVVSGSVGITVQ